jgi:hypothetical protein
MTDRETSVPVRQTSFPERVTLDRCIGCGWLTTGAWMHGPCPVCEGERYEACEYVSATDEAIGNAA